MISMWDKMVEESNHYEHQKLRIKKVIAKNKFEYLTCFIHFNDSTMEPTEITITFSTFDLFYVMPILNVGGFSAH